MVFLYVFIAILFEPILIFNRYQHYAVLTNSMEPTIMVGDLVISDERASHDDLRVGDIIVFEVPEQDLSPIIHYIHDIEVVDGTRIYATIAENSDTPDPYETTSENIMGHYVFHMPRIGQFMRFISHPIGKAVVIIDVLLIYIIYKIWFSKKEKLDHS